jgi:molecular chaperone GrpE
MTKRNDDDSAEEQATAQSAPSDDRIRELEALVASLEEEAARARDGFLRARADLDNLRKRSARERDEIAARALADSVLPFLETLDDLDRALAEARADGGALAAGVAMIRDALGRRLSDLGIAPIEAAGARFDPAFHEAFGSAPVADAEPDTIVEVVRQGFLIGDRVLRPARVIVAARSADGTANSSGGAGASPGPLST